ncbi:hypothetical protein FISHEDRAFT_74728 [Fistulina hepatica ATCC 64428]|uniref:WW domain-containing protein n=1 Tax=Fistulina hepatica ATCC 64428 TaxID=1128425 RepID=A0A0D7AAK1_9AGAR|nr:hypothetical protein FISHEDRAFT_74728 [Fistulina hepatica ATCC 64428]
MRTPTIESGVTVDVAERQKTLRGSVAEQGLPGISDDENSPFYPILPGNSEEDSYGRYTTARVRKLPKDGVDLCIPRMTISIPPKHLPEPWQTFLHPEGARYFFNPRHRVLTDANIYDKTWYGHVDDCMKKLLDYVRSVNVELDKDVDIVLDVHESTRTEGRIVCGYYLASHTHRNIFWLDDFYTARFENVAGTDLTFWTSALEAQYWEHCSLFPSTLTLTAELLTEVRDMIIHYMGDSLMSVTSTAPYDRDELSTMLGLVGSMESHLSSKSSNHIMLGSTRICGMIMSQLVYQRYIHHHGQPSARLERNQSIFEDGVPQKGWYIYVVAPLLFFAPEMHVRSLSELYTDGVVFQSSWAVFINKLNSEWQEFTVLDTVLLNANVAFLAIQSVDNGDNGHRSWIQIASYISVVTSVGSIIIGLMLMRMNRMKSRDTATMASNFLLRHPLSKLSMLYSLPYALLMWSTLSFLVAFCELVFTGMEPRVWSSVGPLWLIVIILIGWNIFFVWERKGQPEEEYSTERHSPRDMIQRIVHRRFRHKFRPSPASTDSQSDTATVNSVPTFLDKSSLHSVGERSTTTATTPEPITIPKDVTSRGRWPPLFSYPPQMSPDTTLVPQSPIGGFGSTSTGNDGKSWYFPKDRRRSTHQMFEEP